MKRTLKLLGLCCLFSLSATGFGNSSTGGKGVSFLGKATLEEWRGFIKRMNDGAVAASKQLATTDNGAGSEQLPLKDRVSNKEEGIVSEFLKELDVVSEIFQRMEQLSMETQYAENQYMNSQIESIEPSEEKMKASHFMNSALGRKFSKNLDELSGVYNIAQLIFNEKNVETKILEKISNKDKGILLEIFTIIKENGSQDYNDVLESLDAFKENQPFDTVLKKLNWGGIKSSDDYGQYNTTASYLYIGTGFVVTKLLEDFGIPYFIKHEDFQTFACSLGDAVGTESPELSMLKEFMISKER